LSDFSRTSETTKIDQKAIRPNKITIKCSKNILKITRNFSALNVSHNFLNMQAKATKLFRVATFLEMSLGTIWYDIMP